MDPTQPSTATIQGSGPRISQFICELQLPVLVPKKRFEIVDHSSRNTPTLAHPDDLTSLPAFDHDPTHDVVAAMYCSRRGHEPEEYHLLIVPVTTLLALSDAMRDRYPHRVHGAQTAKVPWADWGLGPAGACWLDLRITSAPGRLTRLSSLGSRVAIGLWARQRDYSVETEEGENSTNSEDSSAIEDFTGSGGFEDEYLHECGDSVSESDDTEDAIPVTVELLVLDVHPYARVPVSRELSAGSFQAFGLRKDEEAGTEAVENATPSFEVATGSWPVFAVPIQTSLPYRVTRRQFTFPPCFELDAGLVNDALLFYVRHSS